MKFYITRHGQVAPKENYGDAQFPAGDPPLTELGRAQASRLGDYMRHIGFRGPLYTSPYARTMETAEIIADKTGSKIIPTAFMREILKSEWVPGTFHGMRLEQIQKRFRHVDASAGLPYPWWSPHSDTEEDVFARVSKGFSELNPQEDAMFVGHGASAGHLIHFLNIPKKSGRNLCNCSLSILDTEDSKNSLYFDTAHLPYKMVGMNTVMLSDLDGEKMKIIMKRGINVPKELSASNSLKLLHIGDTSSFTYPYYQELILKVKPDIILHTGDMVDEVKAGRMIGTREEYEAGLIQIADILKNSGAKEIYVVPGNNDLPELIKKHAPFAKVLAPDTQLKIGGITCTVAHAWYEVKTKSEWYFYGHGTSGEPWKPEQNDKNSVCHFNAVWGPKAFLLPERKLYEFSRPEDLEL